MKPAEAIEVCERWFAHNEAHRKRSAEMQRLATMARNGQAQDARRLMAQLDRTPLVFDGAPLEEAVRVLVRATQRQVIVQPTEGDERR